MKKVLYPQSLLAIYGDVDNKYKKLLKEALLSRFRQTKIVGVKL